MLKYFLRKLFSKFHFKKIIIFESYPDFSDSSLCLFIELKNRELDKKYTFVWQIFSKNEELQEMLNAKKVKYYFENPSNKLERIKLSYYRHNADVIICGNNFVKRYFDRQKYLYVTHGIALKDISSYYYIPEYLKEIDALTFSENLFDTTAYALHCKKEQLLALGLPRNDELLIRKVDLKSLFNCYSFNKVIYWLPTFRKHSLYDTVHSGISIPVIHNLELCKDINRFAKENNVLIVIKPHFIQDLSAINTEDYSNIIFINEKFLNNNGITNYSLLGSCDALLTDYSSVFYDYLLCNKPIGLCWEDFEEYNENAGFICGAVEQMEKACEIIYNADDLKQFIQQIAFEDDIKSNDRMQIAKYVHKFFDGNSTKRVADYIENNYL